MLHPPLQGEGRAPRVRGVGCAAAQGVAARLRALSPHPAALRAATFPLQGKVGRNIVTGAVTIPLTTAAAETTCPKPCAATGVSRDDPDNGSKGGAEQKEGAAVERREARPPPHLPPPRERCGGGMPRPKRRRRRRRLRGAESAQRLPALRSRRFWGAIRFLPLAIVRPRQHSSGAHASRERLPFPPPRSGGGGPLELAQRANRGGGGAGRGASFSLLKILFAGRSERANMSEHHEDSCGALSPAPPPPPCFAGWSPSPASRGRMTRPARNDKVDT